MPDSLDVTDQNARYLDNLMEQNPILAEYSARLYLDNKLPVGTYVLDLDAHVRNASIMIEEARRSKLHMYYMSKQIARNPIVAQAVVNTGFDGLVTVEPQELRSLSRYGIKVAHVGHLENTPENDIDFVLKEVKPEVMTVFNVEKAKMISDHALRLGKRQDLLIRPIGPRDVTFPYMEGGFPEKDAIEAIKKINTFEGVRVVGLTNFPCLLYELTAGKPIPTENLETLIRLRSEVERQGIEISQMNTPPFCTSKTIPIYAAKGSTHLEPGLGISGMSPWQIYAPELHREIPAATYVTEVSHFVGDFGYVYGGGFTYIEIYEFSKNGIPYSPDPLLCKMKALVGRTPGEAMRNPVDAEHYHGILDYHARLYRNPGVKVGDVAVYGFRTQMFVTRAQVAVVAGTSTNNPELVGIFDQANNLIDRHGHLLGEASTIKLMEKYAQPSSPAPS
jgi:predicted amino acid racemase